MDKEPPDKNCNTLPNGDCIGQNCMHDDRIRSALINARGTLVACGFVGPGPHGPGDPEINEIDEVLRCQTPEQ